MLVQAAGVDVMAPPLPRRETLVSLQLVSLFSTRLLLKGCLDAQRRPLNWPFPGSSTSFS